MKNIWNRLSNKQKTAIKIVGISLVVVGGTIIAVKYHKRSLGKAFSKGLEVGIDEGLSMSSGSFNRGFDLGKLSELNRIRRVLKYLDLSDPRVGRIFSKEGIEGLIDYAIRLKKFRGG